MTYLADKKEPINWADVSRAQFEWRRELLSRINHKEFTELFLGRFESSKDAHDHREKS